MNFGGLNSLDMMLLLALLVGMLIGLVRGTVSQIISAVSIWLGLVATLWLYKLFSDYIIQDSLGIGKTGGDTLAFVTLLILFFNGFRLVVRALTVPPEDRRKKRRKDRDDPLAVAAKTASERAVGCVNAVGGMAMGLALTVLWLALFLGVVQFILQPSGVPLGGFSRSLVENLGNSFLRPYFDNVLWGLSASLDLFIPKNADIFRVVLRTILETSG